ncbi:hypothetical protein THAOC_13701, partial [Thalassiosira oceanica]
KSVLLTGASRGLGRSLATRLASCGVSELVLSGRDSEALDGVRAECLRLGPDVKVRVVPCDLADKESVDELAREAIASCDGGAVDVLINNGGISSRSSFLETNFEIDERLMRVNFLSGAQLAKAVAPGMVGRGSGRIVWVSSVQGRIGTPFRTSYAGSKFAVAGYCEALRSELSSRGVAVHVASPGYVRTGLSRSAVTGDGSAYGKTDETTANGADPDDVATYILDSVAAGRTDFVVAATFSARLAIWLKFLAPSFLEKQLVKRKRAVVAPADVAAPVVLDVDARVLQELLHRPDVPGTVVLEVRQHDVPVVLLQLLLRALRVPHHVLDPLYRDRLQLGVEPRPRPPEDPSRVLPELRQAHPAWPVLVGYEILPGGVDVPPVRPGSEAERDLLPHEAPRQERVERHVDKELAPGEEEPGGDVSDLGRRAVGTVAGIPRVDPQYLVLDVRVAEGACAKPRSRRPPLVRGIPLVETRGVRAQYRLGVALRRLDLLDVQPVPLGGETEVRVALHEVRLAPPELAGEVPRRGGPVALRLVDVQHPDLSGVAVLHVPRIAAELLDAVVIRGPVADLGDGPALLVLPLDLDASPALDVDPEAVLHDRADEELVGTRRVLEGLPQRLAEEVVAVGPQAHEDGAVLPYREDRPVAVGVLERLEVLVDEAEVRLDDLVGGLGVPPRLEHGVEVAEEPLEDRYDARDRRLVVRQRVGDDGLAEEVHGHGVRGHGRELGVQVRRPVRRVRRGLLLCAVVLPGLGLLLLGRLEVRPELLPEVVPLGHVALAPRGPLDLAQLLHPLVHQPVEGVVLRQVEHPLDLLGLLPVRPPHAVQLRHDPALAGPLPLPLARVRPEPAAALLGRDGVVHARDAADVAVQEAVARLVRLEAGHEEEQRQEERAPGSHYQGQDHLHVAVVVGPGAALPLPPGLAQAAGGARRGVFAKLAGVALHAVAIRVRHDDNMREIFSLVGTLPKQQVYR